MYLRLHKPAVFSWLSTAVFCALGATPIVNEARYPQGLYQAGGIKKSDSVVKITAEATAPDAEGKQIVTLKMEIEPGWHIYANPVGQEDLASVQTTVSVKAKNKLEDVNIAYPPGKEIDDKVLGKYRIYEEKVQIKASAKRKSGDKEPLEITVKFQSCTDRQCLIPATVKLKVPE